MPNYIVSYHLLLFSPARWWHEALTNNLKFKKIYPKPKATEEQVQKCVSYHIHYMFHRKPNLISLAGSDRMSSTKAGESATSIHWPGASRESPFYHALLSRYYKTEWLILILLVLPLTTMKILLSPFTLTLTLSVSRGIRSSRRSNLDLGYRGGTRGGMCELIGNLHYMDVYGWRSSPIGSIQ